MLGIFGKKKKPISLKEDRRIARIFRENPYSAEASEIKLQKWESLDYLDRFISRSDIKEFKALYEGSPVALVDVVSGYNQQRRRDFQTYCLNPSFYNNRLG